VRARLNRVPGFTPERSEELGAIGLCAAAQVDDDSGLCPGGLTHGEYYALEDEQQQPGGPRQPRRGSGRSFRGGGVLPCLGGVLPASEGPNRAHTLAVHVNVDRNFIKQRAQRRGVASRFYNLQVAESAVGHVISSNQVQIGQWLAPGNYSRDLILRMPAPGNAGEVAFRNGSITAGRMFFKETAPRLRCLLHLVSTILGRIPISPS
jgi:hypothetical protein